jgi:hypothetical protein
VLVDDPDEAGRLHEQRDRCFVQPWNSKRGLRTYTNAETGAHTSYSSEPRKGLRFAWYSDRPCKFTGIVDCFHKEARAVGARAVRDTLGIKSLADLSHFDAEAFWSKWDREYSGPGSAWSNASQHLAGQPPASATPV